MNVVELFAEPFELFDTNTGKTVDSVIRHSTETVPYLKGIGADYTDCSTGSEWVSTLYSNSDKKYIVEPVSFDSLSVPNVKGMNITDAVYLLENKGWNIAFEGSGRVIHQSVKAGDTLQPGSLITLTLGK